jgi:N utilization substance protein B
MAKNLAKHKVAVKTRECIIQALYQSLMEPSSVELLMQQFTKENNPKKISFDLLKSRLKYFFANEEQIIKLLDARNKGDNYQVIDKAIMAYALIERDLKELPKEVIFDESIRLARKFSNENAYKFINAKLEKIYDL